MTSCLVDRCTAGAGGAGNNGSPGSLSLKGGNGGMGNNGGGGGAISYFGLSARGSGVLELKRSSFRFCHAGIGGSGGNAARGGDNEARAGPGGPGGDGGFIDCSFSNVHTIDQCHFEGGSVPLGGLNGLSPLQVSDGSARSGRGGGIYLNADSSLDMSRSSVVSCRSENLGGGIFVYGSELRLASCTLAENESGDEGSALYLNEESTAFINHGTISGNSGPAMVTDEFSELHLRNTVVVNNTPRTNGGVLDVPVWISKGNNVMDNADNSPRLLSDAIGLFNAPFPYQAADVYAAYYPNDHAPRLIDGAPPSPLGDPFLTSETDILGFPRVVGGKADIGSYESTSSLEIEFTGCRMSFFPRSGIRTLALQYRTSEPDLPVRVSSRRTVDGSFGLSGVENLGLIQSVSSTFFVQSNGTEDEIFLPLDWVLDQQETLGFHALSIAPSPPFRLFIQN